MAYNEIPQDAISGTFIPRETFGQYTRDNFIDHEARLAALPRGAVGNVVINSSPYVSTETVVAGLYVTFTAEANRTYEAVLTAERPDKDGGQDGAYSDSKGSCEIITRYAAGSAITITSTSIVQCQAAVFADGSLQATGLSESGLFSPPAGQVTVGATMYPQFYGTGFQVRLLGQTYLYVKDVGQAIAGVP